MQFDAIIFDMDGLLVDSEPVWYEVEEEVFAMHGIKIELEVRNRFVGLRNDEFLHGLRDHYQLDISPQLLHDEVMARMLQVAAHKARPMPGVSEMLDYVREQNIPSAIASSSPLALIECIVEGHQWNDLFLSLCSAEFLARGKPAPDVYLKAAEQIGIRPERCLALEDSPNGARAAIAAGMTCYAVPDLSHTSLSAFDGVNATLFDSLHSVLKALRQAE